VTLDYLQPADGLAALSSAHVDAWDIWSPFIEQALSQDHARILVNGVGYGSPYSFTIASRAALADPGKAEAIRDYLKLLNQAHACGHLGVRAEDRSVFKAGSVGVGGATGGRRDGHGQAA
jgi:hypothetical protein